MLFSPFFNWAVKLNPFPRIYRGSWIHKSSRRTTGSRRLPPRVNERSSVTRIPFIAFFRCVSLKCQSDAFDTYKYFLAKFKNLNGQWSYDTKDKCALFCYPTLLNSISFYRNAISFILGTYLTIRGFVYNLV